MELHRRVRIRLAGWQNDRPVPLDEDIAHYQKLESPFIEWRDRLESAAAGNDGIGGMTDAMRREVKHFRERGGHISRLPPETIRFIMQHGIVIFLEMMIRDRLAVTFGSVSALSAAPASVNADVDQNLLGKCRFPNMEVADLGVPSFLRDGIFEHPEHVLYICRSSIQEILQSDGVLPHEAEEIPLQRHGLAGLGKAIVFAEGMLRGNTQVMMNIGCLQTNEDGMIAMDDFRTNQPSRRHNRWLTNYGWRLQYCNEIVPHLVTMFWQAYFGFLHDGMQNVHEILKKKGWDEQQVITTTTTIHHQMEDDIRHGRHAPWGDLTWQAEGSA